MASLKTGYQTIQSENFDPIDAEEAETNAAGSHAKFIALVMFLFVIAASIATIFAVIS
jgi:hypothetical protein